MLLWLHRRLASIGWHALRKLSRRHVIDENNCQSVSSINTFDAARKSWSWFWKSLVYITVYFDPPCRQPGTTF